MEFMGCERGLQNDVIFSAEHRTWKNYPACVSFSLDCISQLRLPDDITPRRVFLAEILLMKMTAMRHRRSATDPRAFRTLRANE